MASLIALYLTVIIFNNNVMSKRRSNTIRYSSTTTTTSAPKSIRNENEYKQIFLFVNNLNLVTNNYETFRPNYIQRKEVYDGENGVVYHEIENSLKRANSAGITDFLIPESSIYVHELATIQVLEALVKLSFSYNITINMLLDYQFLILPDSLIRLGINKFYSHSYKTISSKYYGLVLDPSEPSLKLLIEDRIREFSKCKIRNFYFGENPLYSVPRNNDLNKSEMVDFFDYDLLYERAQFILNISDKNKIFYFYEILDDRYNLDQFESKLRAPNDKGILFHSFWDPFYMTFFPEIPLSLIFQKSKTKKKVITFFLGIMEDNVDYLDVVLGIYLFSPVPIVLVAEDKYTLPLYTNILTNQALLPHERYAKVNSAYLWVLKIMKENPFFQNNPSLLEELKVEDDVISAISGTKENGNVSELLFLLYNRKNSNLNVDLNQYFPGWSFQTYSILYDSVPQEKSCLLNQSGEIELSRQQILIIQPNLIF